LAIDSFIAGCITRCELRFDINVSGGTPPYTYKIWRAGTLIHNDTSDGNIDYAPDVPIKGQGNTFSYEAQVIDADGNSTSVVPLGYDVEVYDPPTLSGGEIFMPSCGGASVGSCGS
jgi:hypothetical protein